jgi:Uma2 family endonuclease
MQAAARIARVPIVPATFAWEPTDMARFTVAQYHEMGRIGILKTSDRVELLDGWIVRKPMISPAHSYAVHWLSTALPAILSEDWVVRSQQPVTLSTSEPEPDVVVATAPGTKYRERHPGPREVALVIEVADDSLARDRGIKLKKYAAAKVPEYWIVNIPDRRVEVYTQPRGGKSPAYRGHRDYGPRESVPLALAGKDRGAIPVREILPR